MTKDSIEQFSGTIEEKINLINKLIVGVVDVHKIKIKICYVYLLFKIYILVRLILYKSYNITIIAGSINSSIPISIFSLLTHRLIKYFSCLWICSVTIIS